jgi:hypothetical protein
MDRKHELTALAPELALSLIYSIPCAHEDTPGATRTRSRISYVFPNPLDDQSLDQKGPTTT